MKKTKKNATPRCPREASLWHAGGMIEGRPPCEPQHRNSWSSGGTPPQTVRLPTFEVRDGCGMPPQPSSPQNPPLSTVTVKVWAGRPQVPSQATKTTPPDGWNFRIGAQGPRMGTSTRGHRGQGAPGQSITDQSCRPLAAWRGTSVRGAVRRPALSIDPLLQNGQPSGFDAGTLRGQPSVSSGPLLPSGLARNHQTTTSKPYPVNAPNHGWSVGGATQVTTPRGST